MGKKVKEIANPDCWYIGSGKVVPARMLHRRVGNEAVVEDKYGDVAVQPKNIFTSEADAKKELLRRCLVTIRNLTARLDALR